MLKIEEYTKKTTDELNDAIQRFNYADNQPDIDIAIIDMDAAEKKLDMLLVLSKQ